MEITKGFKAIILTTVNDNRAIIIRLIYGGGRWSLDSLFFKLHKT